MFEIASGSVDAVAVDPVLLAQLGLVFGVADDLAELDLAVGELTLLAVDAVTDVFEVPADFRFVSRVGHRLGRRYVFYTQTILIKFTYIYASCLPMMRVFFLKSRPRLNRKYFKLRLMKLNKLIRNLVC